MNIHQRLAELTAQGKSLALATVTKTTGSVPRHAGSKMLVFPNGKIEGSVGGGEMEKRVIEIAQAALEDGRTQTLSYTLNDPAKGDPGLCGGTVEVFVEPIKSQSKLLIIGAGHVGQALAHLGDWLGYRIEVNDDRPDFCTPENMPQAKAFYPGPLSEQIKNITITRQTYIVLSTRNLEVDLDALPILLESPAAYFGVIGSKRRWTLARKKLQKAGVPDELLDRVTSPMGLEIRAETPEEIALSILAEIIMLDRGGDGKSMAE